MAMTEEIRKSFHAELDMVRDQIVQFAASVTEVVPRATRALLDGNLTEAQEIIDADDNLDVVAVAIEEKCQRLLALQQPMATDLRRIIAAMWITAELERTADLACNICKATRRMYGAGFGPRIRGLIAEMNDEAVRITQLGIDAYVDENAGLAAALDDIDDRLDDLQGSFVRAIFEVRSGGGLDLQPAVQLALIARYYERIGDHAVNIGERVRYLVDGWMPEYTGVARANERSRRQGLLRDIADEEDQR